MNLPKTIQGFYIVMAEYYQIEISEPTLNIYAQDLRNHTVTELCAAWEAYKIDPKNTILPKPNQLRAIMAPIMDVKATGNMIASRLMAVADKQGKDFLFSSFGEKEIGAGYYDLARIVVTNRGGWCRFCDMYFTTSNDDTFRAQLRDELAATLDAARKGMVYSAPALTDSPRTLKLVGDLAEQKSLEGGKN